MFIVRDYEDLEKFVKEKTTGFGIYVYYDGRISQVKITPEIKLEFKNDNLQKSLLTTKEMYVTFQYMFINKKNIEKSFSDQHVLSNKMSEDELEVLRDSFNSGNSYSGKEISNIVGRSIEHIAKTSCFSLEELQNDKFDFIEVFCIRDYPDPVRLLQYVRKHCNKTEGIQMNAYISDCNEMVRDYLNQFKDEKTRKNLEGVYLQLFQRVVEKVIDFQCLMHVRKLMDVFLINYEKKEYMQCFRLQRVILHSLEQNSKN